jgi:hypothetical protein
MVRESALTTANHAGVTLFHMYSPKSKSSRVMGCIQVTVSEHSVASEKVRNGGVQAANQTSDSNSRSSLLLQKSISIQLFYLRRRRRFCRNTV